MFFFVGWNKEQPPFAAAERGNTKPLSVSWLYMKGHQWGYANQKDGDLKIRTAWIVGMPPGSGLSPSFRSIVIPLGFCLWTKRI